VLKTFISAVPVQQISLNDVVVEEYTDTDLDFFDLPDNVLVSAVEGIEQRHLVEIDFHINRICENLKI
jgi:hypothetical protein